MKSIGIASVLLVLTALVLGGQGLASARDAADKVQARDGTTPSDVREEVQAVGDDITPSDVLRELQAMANGVEAIRFYMGGPKTDQAPVDFQNVAPHEVIYLAGTLFEKTNRLSYELIREMENKPRMPDGEITPGDVVEVVRSANKIVSRIVQELDLVVIPTPLYQGQDMTPTDAFMAVVQLNRQINLLLEKKYLPADTYEELSLAIAIAARIRSQWPGERIPQPTDLEPGKTPADVYRRLIEYRRLVKQIADRSGLKVLEVVVNEEGIEAATPSDVHDIAALLSADLSYIDRKLLGPSNLRPQRYPGRKVPSEVYQRAGILGDQLNQILEREALESPSESTGAGE